MIKILKSKSKDFNKLYIIPNVITYSNMILGAIAIFISIIGNRHNLKIASLLIITAGVMDKLDGYIARKLNIASKFGKELDSLCDLVSFGIAPVILWWNINTGKLGLIEMIGSIIFIGAGIFRLAKFNITKDQGYIIGLPITIAGMIMAIKHFIDISYRIGNRDYMINLENLLLMFLLSLFMISKFRIKKPL